MFKDLNWITFQNNFVMQSFCLNIINHILVRNTCQRIWRFAKLLKETVYLTSLCTIFKSLFQSFHLIKLLHWWVVVGCYSPHWVIQPNMFRVSQSQTSLQVSAPAPVMIHSPPPTPETPDMITALQTNLPQQNWKIYFEGKCISFCFPLCKICWVDILQIIVCGQDLETNQSQITRAVMKTMRRHSA